MKTKLLLLACFTFFSVNAQTTHDLDWFAGIGSNVDLTIDVGDTVRWTWTSPSHTVENVPGSSVETFNSGFLAATGSIYSYTFTVVGDNDYFCGVHGAFSMSGTITVEDPTASIEDEAFRNFSILPNPASDVLTVKLPSNPNAAEIEVFSIIGQRVLTKSLSTTADAPLDVSNLQSGLYIIRVTSGENSQTKRFVKL